MALIRGDLSSRRRRFRRALALSVLSIACVVVLGCAESVTVTHIEQDDSSEKTKIEIVLDRRLSKDEIAQSVGSFGTALVEGETLVLITPTNPTGTIAPVRDTASLTMPRQAAVSTDIPDYRRNDWPHWDDADGDCQDARQEVLIAEAVGPVTYETARECRVATGGWVGPYTGEQFDDPASLDIDHMVPLSNAHRSGGWAWDRDKKRQYANDLNFAGHLIAVDLSENRSKGNRGPEDWTPPLESYWCTYAVDWVTIKVRWDLTATASEIAALTDMLAACGDAAPLVSPVPAEDRPRPPTPTTQVIDASTATPLSTATPIRPTATPAQDALELYDDNDNGRITCAEARRHGIAPVPRGHPAYQYMTDRDDDGVVCE